MDRPRVHERTALLKQVGSPVGPFNLAADLMAHRLLDDSVRNRRDFLGPSPDVARKPWVVIGRPLAGSIHFAAPAFIRLRSIRNAMFEQGLPCACPGKTKRSHPPFIARCVEAPGAPRPSSRAPPHSTVSAISAVAAQRGLKGVCSAMEKVAPPSLRGAGNLLRQQLGR